MDARAVAELQREVDEWVEWEENERAAEEEWKKAVLREINAEVIKDSVVGRNLKARRFVSRRAWGRDRLYPEEVTLVCYPKEGKRWYAVELLSDYWKVPWDKWATEIFGPQVKSLTRRPEDELRRQVEILLVMSGGRF